MLIISKSNTAEIRVRKMIPEDLTPLHKLLSDPEVMKYLEPPFSEEQTERFLAEAGLCDPALVYSVELQKQFIGYIIYHSYDESSVEIGWVLLPEYWGKGYASEITRLLLEQAKEDNKHVIIECIPQQTASSRIAEKYGFAYCGREGGLDIYKLSR